MKLSELTAEIERVIKRFGDLEIIDHTAHLVAEKIEGDRHIWVDIIEGQGGGHPLGRGHNPEGTSSHKARDFVKQSFERSGGKSTPALDKIYGSYLEHQRKRKEPKESEG